MIGVYKVRVVIGAALLHFVSRTEPRLLVDADGRPVGMEADLIFGADGDVPAFIDWSKVSAVTWRLDGPDKS